MEEEGHSGKQSDQSEVLLRTCSLAISNSETLMGIHSPVIDALSFALFLVLHPFPSLYLQIII